MSATSTNSIDDLDDPEADAVWRKSPRSKTLRRVLRISVEEFGARYRIPVETLQAWEAGTATPDAVAEAYLLAIARDPEGIAKLMQAETRVAAE